MIGGSGCLVMTADGYGPTSLSTGAAWVSAGARPSWPKDRNWAGATECNEISPSSAFVYCACVATYLRHDSSGLSVAWPS